MPLPLLLVTILRILIILSPKNRGNAAMRKFRFALHQIGPGEDKRNYRFTSLDELQHFGLQPEARMYTKVFEGQIEARTSQEALLEVYRTFNIPNGKPAGFSGRSVSVSDIVVLDENQQFYCDRIGWQPITLKLA